MAGVAVGYTLVARSRAGAAVPAADVSLAPGARIAFVSTASGSRGRVATVAVADPGGPRLVSSVSCDRVYAAGGTGICLSADGSLASYRLAVLDDELHG